MTAQWGKINVNDILDPIKGSLRSGPSSDILTGLCTDSRQAGEGHLFFALKGEKFDGHDYVKQAREKGVRCVVVEKGRDIDLPGGLSVVEVKDTLEALGDLARWWRRRHGGPVAVITGSTGKTTTKEMTARILSRGARTLKNRGNFNNLIGLPLTLLSLEPSHRRAVLEMGMNRAGEIGRLTEIADPDVGVITNVAKAHLEGVGDLEGVASAKVEMLEKISSKGRIVLNGDDDLLMKKASFFGRSVITFGMRSGNDIRAQNLMNRGTQGFGFDLVYGGEAYSVRLGVQGLHNIYNAAAASAIAFCLGESPENILEGLEDFQGVEGRFMVRRLRNGTILVDDTYNSNPYSLKAAVDSIKEMAVNGGRVLVGLGEMMELGRETVSSHLEAGGMVADLGAAYFVAMGEHADEMLKGALEKGLPLERTTRADSHGEMAQILSERLRKGDTIFLKGSRRAGLEKVVQRLTERSLEEEIT